MNTGIAIINGVEMPLEEATIPVTDLGFLRGYAAFDTVRSEGGKLPCLGEHLQRFAQSCRSTGVGKIDLDVVEAEVRRVAELLGGDGVIRMTLTGSGCRLVLGWLSEEGRFHRPMRAARGTHVQTPILGGVSKHHSRMHWIVAVQQKGVDDVLLVDAEGRFTEGTTCGVLAIVNGVIHSAPYDGRILESMTMKTYLRRAEALGIEVVRQGALAAGPWDALYVTSTTRKLAPVAEIDGEMLATWDAVGRQLVADDGFSPGT